MTAKLNDRESLAINCIKAFAILSVIAAHTVLLDTNSVFSGIVTSLWTVFSRVGVVTFYIVGGFLYNRKDGDNKIYWQKKFFRIVIPWLICSAITYLIGLVGGNDFSLCGYIKWIFGSGTWYYYIVIYVLFLIVFKLFYKHTSILWILFLMQTLFIALNTFGINTTPKIGFFTDYLNPLFWIGYFSLGILIRRYRLDVKLRENKLILITATIVMICTTMVMHIYGIYTYFSLITMVNCLAAAVLLWDISYLIANTKASVITKSIGVSTYCIYLLHMQIVQTAVGFLPATGLTYLCAPFLGLAIMMILVYMANWVCGKLPFGKKLKMCFGL